MSRQPSLFDDPAPGPPVEGLRYEEDFLSPGEEADLTARFSALPFKPFAFGPYTGKREVVSFGHRYDYSDRRMKPAAPTPDFLTGLAARAEAWAGLPAASLSQALVTRYAPGVTIGWHRDRPEFAEVVGVSLLSPCTLRLRRREGGGWARAALTLAPRSVYLFSGPVRSVWEHSIPPVEALRYSVTFRRLSAKGAAAASAPSD
jgi:alkylated DNA repair dioxygenase AlkB